MAEENRSIKRTLGIELARIGISAALDAALAVLIAAQRLKARKIRIAGKEFFCNGMGIFILIGDIFLF